MYCRILLFHRRRRLNFRHLDPHLIAFQTNILALNAAVDRQDRCRRSGGGWRVAASAIGAGYQYAVGTVAGVAGAAGTAKK
jgi:hypothetical protein